MDIYILDRQFRRVDVLDDYISMVWGERMIPHHDVKIQMPYAQSALDRLKAGTYLSIQPSRIVMEVETVSVKTDDDERIVEILGRGVEKIFDDRIGSYGMTSKYDQISGDEITPKIFGTPAACMRSFVIDMLDNNPNDDFPGMTYAIPFNTEPSGSIPADTQYTISFEIGPLTEVLNGIAEAFLHGWRLLLDPATNTLFFDVYVGDDRTTRQTTFPPVVFSDEFGNLASMNFLQSTKLYKNVAYVYSKKERMVVLPEGVTEEPTGYDRRVLFVEADDVDPEGLTAQEFNDILVQRGRKLLAQHIPVIMMEGEANIHSGYQYNVDYALGDRVEFRDSVGNRSIMVVTEQVFVVDAEGTKSYPTLSYYGLSTAGTWDAYNPTQYWLDVPDDAEHEWEDLP